MNELTKLPGIGEKIAEQLNQVGIYSLADLQKVGAKDAWLKILAIDDSACMNRLLALYGAENGLEKAELTDDIKQGLQDFYRNAKGVK